MRTGRAFRFFRALTFAFIATSMAVAQSIPANQPGAIFLNPLTYSSGEKSAELVAVADVNGDGKLDVIVANSSGTGKCANGCLGVLLGNGDGTFQPPMTFGGPAVSIAIADVNGDGNPDIVTATGQGVGVLLGNGDGTFQNEVLYGSSGDITSSVAVADMNNDGKPDIVVTINGVVGVLYGYGNGTFRKPVINAAAEGTAVAVADLNRDGNQDIILASSTQGFSSVTVLLGNGNGTFADPVTYGTGEQNATSVAVADVNGDGIPDVMVTSQTDPGNFGGSGFVNVFLGNGDGTLGTRYSYVSGGYNATSVVVADVNGDGKPDLLVTNQCAQYYCNGDGELLAILLGNGDGTFAPPATYHLESVGNNIAVGDLNNDGTLDVVEPSFDLASGLTAGAVGVLLGVGNGTFLAPLNYSPQGYSTVFLAAGDLNGDGKPDLAVLNYCGNFDVCGTPFDLSTVNLLFGNGDGTFTEGASYETGAYRAVALALGDANGNGSLDLMIASQCIDNDCGITPIVSVLLNEGNGVFQPAVVTNLDLDPTSIAVADLNSDGKADVVVTNGQDVEVLLGNGGGTFQSAVPYSTGGYGPQFVAIGDVNGDGKLDLVVANSSGNYVSVLLGNGDGTFQPACNFSAFEATSIALADLNNDGKLDVVIAGSTFAVLLGNGDGTFQAPINVVSLTSFPNQPIAIADFNGDGILDVALDGNILLLGKGNGTFRAPMLLGAGGEGIATADFNADGKPDVAVGGVTILLNISPQSTTTKLRSSKNPSNFGESVTFAAAVTHKGSDTPTGTVTFFNDTQKLGSSPVRANGEATLSISSLGTGTDKITALYSGDANFTSSKSSALSQVVQ